MLSDVMSKSTHFPFLSSLQSYWLECPKWIAYAPVNRTLRGMSVVATETTL